MRMSEFDGWKFMEKIRQVPGCNAIPVIVASGMAPGSMEWTKSLGAVGLLKKPIDPDALLNAVRQHC
jgi:CheY-like chemotaxis protein